MSDTDLEAIRHARLQQLQQSQGGGGSPSSGSGNQQQDEQKSAPLLLPTTTPPLTATDNANPTPAPPSSPKFSSPSPRTGWDASAW